MPVRPKEVLKSRGKSDNTTERRDDRSDRDSRSRYSHPRVVFSESDVSKLEKKGYKIEKSLSSGTSAQIFLMTYKTPGMVNSPTVKMACKVIDKANIEEKFVKKFLPREITILAELDHPHCVTVYSMMEMNMKCFLFMRYAENGDLLDYLTKHGATDDNHARLWMRQMMLALDYLNSKNIAHRDIKCENILVTENLNLKLADFGFARTWMGTDGKEQLSETYCGSLSYAAPEVLLGKPHCPKRVDIWSMGVVLFIMFNLTKPFNRNRPTHVLQLQLQKAYKWTQHGIKLASSGSRNMVAQMLEPQMSLRPPPSFFLREAWMNEDPDVVRFLPDPRAHDR